MITGIGTSSACFGPMLFRALPTRPASVVPGTTGSSSSVVVPASVRAGVGGRGLGLRLLGRGAGRDGVVLRPELPEPPPALFMAAVIDARMSV